jgi:hypothetical protein
MAFKSYNHLIEIYISSFPLRLLCILICLAKLLIVYKYHTHQNYAIHAHAMHMLIVVPHWNYAKNIMGINPSTSWELPQEHHGN